MKSNKRGDRFPFAQRECVYEGVVVGINLLRNTAGFIVGVRVVNEPNSFAPSVTTFPEFKTIAEFA